MHRKIASFDWPAGTADLAARVTALRAAKIAHSQTVDVPAPRDEPLVEELEAYSGTFEVLPPEPPELPPSPGPAYDWNGTAWVLNPVKVEQQRVAALQSRLREIDLASIRSIREWVAAQPGAPRHILDHEVAAVAERAKLS